MTDYDIQRTAKAIVDLLVTDDRFIERVAKIVPKQTRLLNTRQAAKKLGISQYTMRHIAAKVGGIQSPSTGKKRESGHWYFDENTLLKEYLAYKNINC